MRGRVAWAFAGAVVAMAGCGGGSTATQPTPVPTPQPAPTSSVGTARYRVTFEATWSAATHPTSFPGNPHFSPLIGGSHSARVVFWQPGGTASTGIEAMAEQGSTSPFDAEIQAAIASYQVHDAELEALSASYSADHAAQLRARSFDREALGRRGPGLERLDQLTVELLLGAR